MKLPAFLPSTLVPGLLGALAMATACQTGNLPQCTVGADCASGACLGDGTCAPLSTHDSGSAGDSGSPGMTMRDATVTEGDAPISPPPMMEEAGCLPDDAGVVARDQVFFQAGLMATFLTADNVTISTAGTTNPDGSRSWDYSGALAGDQKVLVQTLPVTGAWYAAQFPSSGYVSQLSHTEPLFGVFAAGDTAIVLNGVVSQTAGTMQTELSYNPPAITLSFPLTMGATWQSTSNITGTAEGIPSDYTEEYQSKVDAHGTLVTPYATFPVLRVATLLTRTVGVYPTYTQSFLFVTACFGTVASITAPTSQANPGMGDFSTVSEIQRLAP
jgi:hypothetical protein